MINSGFSIVKGDNICKSSSVRTSFPLVIFTAAEKSLQVFLILYEYTSDQILQCSLRSRDWSTVEGHLGADHNLVSAEVHHRGKVVGRIELYADFWGLARSFRYNYCNIINSGNIGNSVLGFGFHRK